MPAPSAPLQSHLLWDLLQEVRGSQHLPEIPHHGQVHHEDTGQQLRDHHLHVSGHLSCGHLQVDMGHSTGAGHPVLYPALQSRGSVCPAVYVAGSTQPFSCQKGIFPKKGRGTRPAMDPGWDFVLSPGAGRVLPAFQALLLLLPQVLSSRPTCSTASASSPWTGSTRWSCHMVASVGPWPSPWSSCWTGKR